MTREELDAVRNHISNLPTVGAMYAPVLVEWVSVLLRQRDEVTAQRDNAVDASKEGAWMARALDAERERDEALAQVARREREHEALVETAQKALALAQARYTDACDALGIDHNDSLAHRIRMALESARYKYDQKVAEIEMLRGVGCREAKEGEPKSGPCGVCLRCAEEQGAEWALEIALDPSRWPVSAWTPEEVCRDARGK